MSKKGVVKKSVSSLFNVRRWVAWDEVKGHGSLIISLFKGVTKLPHKEAAQGETFDQVVNRLGLTEQDIKQNMKIRLRAVFIYLALALGLVIYMIYMIMNSHWLAVFFCILLTALLLAYAFRDHVWYTEMKHRKFHCTVKEWIRLTLKDLKVIK